MTEPASDDRLIKATARIVIAQLGGPAIAPGDLPGLIRSVHDALAAMDKPPLPEAPQRVPAVSIKASVKPDYIVCLEDGQKLKMLKRHLLTAYGLTPDAYRARWGLPAGYPMVAPNYSEARSALAHRIGLGQRRPA